jgi:hypothetical protein
MASGEAPLTTPLRLFVDSGVVIEGLFAPWSDSRALLILGRRTRVRLVLADVVRAEVESNLRRLLAGGRHGAGPALTMYARLLRRLNPERVAAPSLDEIAASRHLIRHAADVPVLVSAVRCAPHFLVTTNTRHFTPDTARRTGLRIISPRLLLDRISLAD